MQISVAVIIPLITFSSNCIMVYHSNVKYSTTLALVMRFQLANEACDLRTFCFISQGLPIPLGIHCMVTGPKWCSVYAVKHPICNCVHSYSISPCQTPFFKSMSFATISKPWMATELTKTMCTQVPGAHFRARVQGLELVLGHRHRVRILAWVPSEYRTRAPCQGIKCEGCLTFPRTTNEIGHVCRHAGCLFH